MPQLQFGGLADVASQPLSLHERDSSKSFVPSNGVHLSSFINGPDASSTRTELLGVILTVFSDVVCHLAVDCAAVLSIALRSQCWILSYLHTVPVASLPQSEHVTLRMQPIGK